MTIGEYLEGNSVIKKASQSTLIEPQGDDRNAAVAVS